MKLCQQNNNGVGFAPCRGWQSAAEGMKLGQDLQSPTPDSIASCRPIFQKKYAAQFHRLLKEWLFELVDFQIYGSIVCNERKVQKVS